MMSVAVDITRITDPAFPGWVECILRDAYGATWIFIEKIPVVTTDQLSASSAFPRRGWIACEVLGGKDIDASPCVEIDTSKPWGIAATDGTATFVVQREQLLEA